MQMTAERPVKVKDYRGVKPKYDIRHYIRLIMPVPTTEDGHRNSVQVNFEVCYLDGWTVPAMWRDLDEQERNWVLEKFPGLDPTKDFLPKKVRKQ